MDINKTLSLLKEYKFLFQRPERFEGFMVNPISNNSQKPLRIIDINDLVFEFEEIPLKKEIIDRCEHGIERNGVDALACYVPFHWLNEDSWGIHIKDSSLYYIADRCFSQESDPTQRLSMAFKLLFMHEFFHFLTECAATTMELLLRHHSVDGIYNKYINDVYLQGASASEPMEEGIANAYAYRAFQHDNRMEIDNFFGSQPNGYKSYNSYISHKNFKTGITNLATSISIGRNMFNVSNEYECLQTIFDIGRKYVSFKDVPVYIDQELEYINTPIKLVKTIQMQEIEFENKFLRELSSVPPEITAQYNKNLNLLTKNIHIKSIHFHKLKGYKGIFTFNINGNYRVSMMQNKLPPVKWRFLRIANHNEIDRCPA